MGVSRNNSCGESLSFALRFHDFVFLNDITLKFAWVYRQIIFSVLSDCIPLWLSSDITFRAEWLALIEMGIFPIVAVLCIRPVEKVY